MRLIAAAVLLAGLSCSQCQTIFGPAPPPSDHVVNDIWTSGLVLKAVNDVTLYPDSKTYVDLPLLYDSDVVMAAFEQLPKLSNGSVDRDVLKTFMGNYFGEAGSDLNDWSPVDFKEEPADFLPKVENDTIREWGLAVNDLWNYLSREVNNSIYDGNGRRHSLLSVPYPVVVAGDRFREVYYWDSYFIVRGLLVSGMTTTATNVVWNLVTLLRENGLVPNGARTYYLNRSQPPLLSQMVKVVYEATNDTQFLGQTFAELEMEHYYWTNSPVQVNVTHNGRSYQLSRYWSTLNTPRPESYKEDAATAAGLSPDKQAELWHNLASGAASGWDFSSRWFKDGRNLSTCQASMVLPADLNSFLYQLESNLADFAQILGDPSEEYYREAAATRKEAINTLLWNQTTGHWHDLIIDSISDSYDVTAFHPQTRTYASNWIPLWVGMAEPQSQMASAAVTSFTNSGLIQQGGVLTSLYNTTQQWDAPNAWPCLQYFMVEGIDSYGDAAAQKLAAQIAQTWLESNYIGYLQNGGKMVEKYDGLVPGVEGGGGEYNVQTGFGWTNGVMLYFLQKYGWEPANSLAGSPLILPVNVNAALPTESA